MKRVDAYKNCILCPRKCGADRLDGETGYCGQTFEPVVARAALHYWEEPELSGDKGSGTVFFAGCNLGCVYCQNHKISRDGRMPDRTSLPGEERDLVKLPDPSYKKTDARELADTFLRLQGEGALNINLVTAAMFVPTILDALDDAGSRGLTVPVVYNSSGYESVDTLKMMKGYIDIYLPDLKYLDPALAARYSNAQDYPEVAVKAIAEMVSQTKTIIRHLVLPGHTGESKRVLEYIAKTYGTSVTVSIMSQYTPVEAILKDHPELNRRITKREYDKVVDYALALGLTNAYIQERSVASESFIPEF